MKNNNQNLNSEFDNDLSMKDYYLLGIAVQVVALVDKILIANKKQDSIDRDIKFKKDSNNNFNQQHD